ncbi:HAD-IIIC family phosphatase [Clostridium botulinum]|uniref:HAD-IIIC family phosphatase n=1 Tax=Clostridium botulinum TaxID=1491 RepID=UPI00196881DC|nr:HAD-IIIC family phosphatase [Clostridium botulinum]MBN1050263.1 HAD-IIIC family phosphatase [Clostridium botulinum]
MGNIKIKCVIWDLDNTLWDGILIEDKDVKLKNNIVNIIKTLDSRGILQSICSKNDFSLAWNKLKEFNLEEYFIYPEINWNAKSIGVSNIAKNINIGIDTIAFIDDQVFEREEVKFKFPQVLSLDAAVIDSLLDMDEMNPRFITEDSKSRRMLYMNDIKRNKDEEIFEGTAEEFLKSLNLVFKVENVKADDLKRAEELTVRTHQLNATGYTYSYEELEQLSKSDNHGVLIAQLEDKYGDYGKIGLALVEKKDKTWILKLLLMSCRVVSRGVGSVMLNYIMNKAKSENVKLLAEFVPTDRNRMMYITYKFNGFNETNNEDGKVLFEADLNNLKSLPEYIELIPN